MSEGEFSKEQALLQFADGIILTLPGTLAGKSDILVACTSAYMLIQPVTAPEVLG